MDNLGIDDKIIENLNSIKNWQLEAALWQLLFKRFISSRVIRGSALVDMSGEFWLLLVQGEPKKESFTILSPLRKTFWVVGTMSPSVTRKEN